MAKNNSVHLLVPGESSWEIWSAAAAEPAALHSSHPVAKPSEIEKFPPGELVFFFPVKTFTAIPLHVNTGDNTLFPDLAATHAERLGLRPDPFAGQLTDIFPIFINSEQSTLLSVVLRTPQSEDLPLKSPSAFDLSPRSLPASGNALTLWRELGQWVFAIHLGGKLLYCQATTSSGPSPDPSIIREIRIALAQFSMQGIEATPDHAIIWSSDPDTETSRLSGSLDIPATLALRPAPALPAPPSALLPADVRAARRAARKRQNITAAIAAVSILYLGTIGYLAFQLWQTHSTTQRLLTQVRQVAPEGEAYALHIAKWDELEHGINLNYNTVDILHRVARSIPPNSGLRLRTADISPTDIRLIGEAPQAQAVNQFSVNLSKNNDLLAFTWQTPEPRQSARGWEFVFTGTNQSVAP
jgi:hypothetical protein